MMGARIFVESAEEHEAWLAENSTLSNTTLSYAANGASQSAEN